MSERTDTGGYKFVNISGTSSCRIISKWYSHQYDQLLAVLVILMALQMFPPQVGGLAPYGSPWGLLFGDIAFLYGILVLVKLS